MSDSCQCVVDKPKPPKKKAAEGGAQRQPQQKSEGHCCGVFTCHVMLFFSGGPELPNKILFLTNLPEETSEKMLEMLFKQ